MDKKAKIERLKAIKEELAHVQATHSKLVKLEESANPMNLSTLLENDLEQAELILAAQDVMTRLQEMAEDLAKTSARDLFPLADRMKAAFGPDASKAFEQSSTHALNSAMEAVRTAKDELGTAILRIEGKLAGNDMAADVPAVDPAMVGGDMASATSDMASDEFAGADAASGPLEEPLGRARKESVEAQAPALTENIDLRVAGRKLIESEGLQSLMNWVLNEAASAMPAAEFVSFAKKVSGRAASDPEATAGWIGKKRYGSAAMAQLSAPTITANDTPELGICESIESSEGSAPSKSKEISKKMAEGVAKAIENNIAKEGKGNAAKVVEAFVARFGNLLEGEGEGLTTASLTEMFVETFGMKPAAFSVMKLKEFMQGREEKEAGAALAAVADKMAKDKNAANKPLASALSGMSTQERSAVNKVTQKMKADGNAPKKLGDLVNAASEVSDGAVKESAQPVSKFARKRQA